MPLLGQRIILFADKINVVFVRICGLFVQSSFRVPFVTSVQAKPKRSEREEDFFDCRARIIPLLSGERDSPTVTRGVRHVGVAFPRASPRDATYRDQSRPQLFARSASELY